MLRATGRGDDAAGPAQPAVPFDFRHRGGRAEDAARAVPAPAARERRGRRGVLPPGHAPAQGAGLAAHARAAGAAARRRGPPHARHPHGRRAPAEAPRLRAPLVPLQALGPRQPAPRLPNRGLGLHARRPLAGRRHPRADRRDLHPAARGLLRGGPARPLRGGLQHHAADPPAPAARREVQGRHRARGPALRRQPQDADERGRLRAGKDCL
mmetsp:Transcript_3050/g.9038  ORF Transcript_3050/g.9038 Transcript_3050/m.9038 type:complete len:211 (-) Transcript_3050:74-706(-)